MRFNILFIFIVNNVFQTGHAFGATIKAVLQPAANAHHPVAMQDPRVDLMEEGSSSLYIRTDQNEQQFKIEMAQSADRKSQMARKDFRQKEKHFLEDWRNHKKSYAYRTGNTDELSVQERKQRGRLLENGKPVLDAKALHSAALGSATTAAMSAHGETYRTERLSIKAETANRSWYALHAKFQARRSKLLRDNREAEFKSAKPHEKQQKKAEFEKSVQKLAADRQAHSQKWVNAYKARLVQDFDTESEVEDELDEKRAMKR